MVRLFLITANVGSIFDNLDEGLPFWLNELSSVVRSKDPEFLAIHFQETGGKSCDVASDAIKEFFRQLVDLMEQLNFRVAEAFVDSVSNVEDQFTALSSIYFVHETLRLPVHIWDFQDAKFHEISRISTPASAVLHPNVHMGASLNLTNRKQKEKFPQNFYPNCKWSRKGFLRTRWRFGSTTVDLVNIHLFHDSCNLMAASVFPSQFAQHREKTLKYTLDRIQSDGLEKGALFIFGDFNFRVNAHGVMEILKKDFGDPVSKMCEDSSLVLATKKFHCPEQELRFKTSYEWLKQYDFEPKQLSGLLQEHDLNFHPTYPFSEEINEPERYMRTRLPAWCDRVLFTPSSRDIFVQDFPMDYNLIGSKVCMGDHKPVGLSLEIQTSDYPPTLNNKLDAGTNSTSDVSPIIKGKLGTMTGFIKELSISSTTLCTSATRDNGTLPKTNIPCETFPAADFESDKSKNLICISSSSLSLQEGSNNNYNGVAKSENGDGISINNIFEAVSSNEPEEKPSDSPQNDLDALDVGFPSPSSTDNSGCFLFGALLRCRGKERRSHGNNGAGNNNGLHNNSCKALAGFKALSKCKPGGGRSCRRSCSLLEPIAGAGCEFACASFPSSEVPSQRPSITESLTTQPDNNPHTPQNYNPSDLSSRQNVNRPNFLGKFFTAAQQRPPHQCIMSNGKVKQSKDCYRNLCSECCCCGNGVYLDEAQPISADCHCQSRLMLNLTTMIANSCTTTGINNSKNNICNGDILPLGSSNLSLIALNSNTDLDKQSFVDSSGKIINDCGNDNSGKIPVCWATTTNKTYNHNSNKLSPKLCANCISSNITLNNKNLHNLNGNGGSSRQHYYSTGGESNSQKCQGNGLPFKFRNCSATQGSPKCKCQKEKMKGTKRECVSCSKCVIL